MKILFENLNTNKIWWRSLPILGINQFLFIFNLAPVPPKLWEVGDESSEGRWHRAHRQDTGGSNTAGAGHTLLRRAASPPAVVSTCGSCGAAQVLLCTGYSIAVLHQACQLSKSESRFSVLQYKLSTYIDAVVLQGDHRDNLRQLRAIMESGHDFLTNEEGIGLTLLQDVTKSTYKFCQQYSSCLLAACSSF